MDRLKVKQYQDPYNSQVYIDYKPIKVYDLYFNKKYILYLDVKNIPYVYVHDIYSLMII